MSSFNDLATVRELATRAGRQLYHIEYVCRTLNIRPVRLIGNVRLFSAADAERILEEVKGNYGPHRVKGQQ